MLWPGAGGQADPGEPAPRPTDMQKRSAPVQRASTRNVATIVAVPPDGAGCGDCRVGCHAVRRRLFCSGASLPRGDATST